MSDLLKTPVAVIGGTGVYDPTWLTDAVVDSVETPYGPVTATRGRTAGRTVVFLNRHGPGHAVPPHRVNYRANIWALRALGVRHVLATTAVGAVNPAVEPGHLLLADQFLDFTHQRIGTFFDGGPGGVVHTDMTEPYCRGLRAGLYRHAERLGLSVRMGGTYVATEGPRFETAQEIRMFRLLGGDVVGMTGVPEVVLAREAGLCYATLCLSTNLGAGLTDNPLTHQEVLEVMAAHVNHLRDLLAAVIPELGRPGDGCRCPAPAGPLPTPP